MAYQWSSAGEVRTTRQHRAATAPSSQAPSEAIPPSLIPGHRHHTFSGTSTATHGLLYFGPSTGTNASLKAPTTAYTPGGDVQGYFSMNPSPNCDLRPPPPPLPMPQSLLPQSAPPLPPKDPVVMSPISTPTLPPKPPPFMYPPTVPRPAAFPRSKSQPTLVPRSASALPHVPPTPPPKLPVLPPKPLGARSQSLTVTSSPNPQPLSQPNVSPSATLSSIVNGPQDTNDDTNDTTLLTLPSDAKSPAEGSLGMNEEEEFELALALSVQTERDQFLALDEDLARAMEQSLNDSAPRPGPSGSRPGPSTLDSESVASSSPTNPRSQQPVSRNVTQSSVDVQLQEDEALARRLEAEYDGEPPTPTLGTNHRADPKPSESPPMSRYADVVVKETGTR